MSSSGVVLRTFLAIILVNCSAISFAAAAPGVPLPKDVRRYQLEWPVFQSKEVTRGEALLAALDGGRALKPWMEHGLPPGVICVLPVPARWWVTAYRADGSQYKIGFSEDGGLVYLPDRIYETNGASSHTLAETIALLEKDLKQEITNSQRPCKYQVGTALDGGTLSGIARLFYGDASKWKAIYEANRKAIKNPDVINDGMMLTIPNAR